MDSGSQFCLECLESEAAMPSTYIAHAVSGGKVMPVRYNFCLTRDQVRKTAVHTFVQSGNGRSQRTQCLTALNVQPQTLFAKSA